MDTTEDRMDPKKGTKTGIGEDETQVRPTDPSTSRASTSTSSQAMWSIPSPAPAHAFPSNLEVASATDVSLFSYKAEESKLTKSQENSDADSAIDSPVA